MFVPFDVCGVCAVKKSKTTEAECNLMQTHKSMLSRMHSRTLPTLESLFYVCVCFKLNSPAAFCDNHFGADLMKFRP